MKDEALVLTNADVRNLLNLPSYIDAMELAYREMAVGTARNMPRQRLFLPLDGPDSQHWFNIHAGVLAGTKIAALRVNSGPVKFETQFGRRRMEFPMALVGLILLFDVDTGALRAIVHDFYVNPVRVACTSALGVRALARADSKSMALLGTGWQARWHLTALMHVRPFKEIRIYSPNPEHRARFVQQQEPRFPGVQFKAAESEEEAVRGADVVVAATNAINPVVKGEWLSPGMHVVSTAAADQLDQRREVDDVVLERSKWVVVNSKLQAELDDQQELLSVMKRGSVSADQVFELSDVFGEGRTWDHSKEDITCHLNNAGMGIQFSAVGAAIYKAALESKVGTRLPYTWRGRET